MKQQKEKKNIIFRWKKWEFAPFFFGALEDLQKQGVVVSESDFARYCIEVGLNGGIQKAKDVHRERSDLEKRFEKTFKRPLPIGAHTLHFTGSPVFIPALTGT